MLEHAGDGEGLLSWRRLVAEYEPATAGNVTAARGSGTDFQR